MTENHPLRCKIILCDALPPEVSAWFPEFSHTEDDDGNTLLTGELPDQAAFIGILFRVHNLNLRILSVQVN